MSKFIEVVRTTFGKITKDGNVLAGTRVLVSVDRIVFIEEDREGNAYIKLTDNQFIITKTKYNEFREVFSRRPLSGFPNG